MFLCTYWGFGDLKLSSCTLQIVDVFFEVGFVPALNFLSHTEGHIHVRWEYATVVLELVHCRNIDSTLSSS